MIAPIEPSSEIQLYLYLWPFELEVFQIDPDPLPEDKSLKIPRDAWWGVWSCRIVLTDPDHEQIVVLFMNMDTGISFLCPGYSADFHGLFEILESTFLAHLHQHGVQLPAKVDFKMTPMRGWEDDAIVAETSIDQLAEVAKAALEEREALGDIQAMLHETVRQPFDHTPAEAFQRAVAAYLPVGWSVDSEAEDDVPF